MITYRVGGLQVVLHDDVPAAYFEADSQRERSFPAGCQVAGAPVRKVVEFYVQQGGMTQYALIGGRFDPAPVDSLTARIGVIPTVDSGAKAFSTELRSPVFAGLPEDLADPAFEGIADYQRSHVLPGGVLMIDRVAHDKYQSSPMAVRHSAGRLVAAIVATVRDGDVEHALRNWYAPRPGATE